MSRAKAEIEQCAERLLRCDKPKIIAGDFNDEDIPLLDPEKEKHFMTAEYLWNLSPQKEGPYKGKLMGLLMDEKLDYVHIVFGSERFVNYTSGFMKDGLQILNKI